MMRPSVYATDTHSLVWYFTEDDRLSAKALAAFIETETGGTLVVPAVVLAEIMYIARKGRITVSFMETLELIERNENIVIAPLDAEILRVADDIEADLEMHDKLIVATALHHGATLITKDSAISDSGVVKTMW